MYVGKRKVRSAGRGSGSVELTLPIRLGMLEGVECHLAVRDGSRPELVIQPDLSQAEVVFCRLWRQLSLGMAEVDEIGDFSSADFTLTLLSAPVPAERPWLCYADALLLQNVCDKASNPWPATDAAREAAGRILSALGTVAAGHLGLEGSAAGAFGEGMAYVMTGVSTDMGADFERGTANLAFLNESLADVDATDRTARNLYDDRTWRSARGGLARIFLQCRDWQDDPHAYTSARDHWFRALSVERGVEAIVPTAATHDWRYRSS